MRTETLAERIVAFIADYDPYEFMDNFEDAEQAVMIMVEGIQTEREQLLEMFGRILENDPTEAEQQEAATLIIALQSVA